MTELDQVDRDPLAVLVTYRSQPSFILRTVGTKDRRQEGRKDIVPTPYSFLTSSGLISPLSSRHSISDSIPPRRRR